MQLPSKYDGTCKKCGKPFSKGETIEWSKEHGANHTRCMQLALFPERENDEANQLADTLHFLKTGEKHERVR
jgi:hypothetical protein